MSPPTPPAPTDEAATRRMAAWVHACGAVLARKLHGETGLGEYADTAEFEQHPDWQEHQRLEVNTRLDGVSRELVYTAREDGDAVKLQKAWVTRLLLNKRGTLAKVEVCYQKKTGRGLYDGDVEEQALAETLTDEKLDAACSRMRLKQWSMEDEMMVQYSILNIKRAYDCLLSTVS